MISKLSALCDLSGGDLCWRVGRALNVIFAVIGFLLLVYWVLDRNPPVTLYDRGTITPTEAKAGDLMQVQWIVSKDRVCQGQTVRVLSGECGSHILRVGDPVEPLLNQPTVIRINFTLPKEVTAGWCEYHTTITYFCNPIQRWFPVVMDYPILRFRVVNP